MKAWACLVLVGGLFFPRFLEAESGGFILWEGPLRRVGIPLVPAQTVEAWYGVYDDGPTSVVVYLTRSPYLIMPGRTVTQGAEETLAVWPSEVLPGGWRWVVFFPEKWPSERRNKWIAAFLEAQQQLPNKIPGRPRPVLPVLVLAH